MARLAPAAATTLAVLGCLALSATPASAIQVVVSGATYEVTTFTDSYDNASSRFSTTEMPWWGNETLATNFRDAVGSSLGYMNVGNNLGAYFSWQTLTGSACNPFAQPNDRCQSFKAQGPIFGLYSGERDTYLVDTFAIATVVPPASNAVPGPLPLFGAAAAFGWSRRLRSRIASSRPHHLN
jgi:hypothetical protein